MLQVHFIRENKQKVLEGLAKRNFADAETIVDQVLTADENRRKTQVSWTKHWQNLINYQKKLVHFLRSGEKQKAGLLKEKSGQLKEQTKELAVKLHAFSDELQRLLYLIPNIPHASVKAGNSEADNEEIYSEGSIPVLGENALPHWELAKKYDIIDFELGTKIAGAGFQYIKERAQGCNVL